MASLKAISNSPRKGNRARSSEAKEEKRQSLLRSALELFTQNGYQGTSIEMITERAGVSTGTFYLYYRNKVELYRILNAEAAGILRKLIEEAIAWPGMTALAQLSAVARAFFRFYSEFRGYYDILSVLHIGQKDFGSHPEMLVPLENQTIAILKLVEAILKRGIENGELTETDTWQTTTALWGMMDGIILLDVKQNLELIGKPIREIFKQGLEIVLRGLTKPSDKGNQ